MSGASVLVVDDEPDIRGLLQEILEDEGYAVSVADNARAAQAAVDESRPDLVLLDIWMPDTDGVTLLKSWSRSGTLGFPVIMISGHGTVETAVEATRHGAVDFIEKPLSLAKLLLTVEKALTDGYSNAANAVGGEARVPAPRRLPLDVGVGAYAQELRERLDEHAASNGSLLIVGETGSGRTLFAQHLHDRRTRMRGAPAEEASATDAPHGDGAGGAAANAAPAPSPAAPPGPFIQLRCDTLSGASAHRELYGDEHDGSPSIGYLESAAGGTLFLADVELLPSSARQCLRQAIESGSFIRHGGRVPVPLRCRLVSSARAPLGQGVRSGARGGSFDRVLARLLSGDTLELAPLREHPEDIPALLEAYVDWHVEEEGLGYRHFTLAAQNRLRNLEWPGNLLELKNFVQRVLLLGGPTEIELAEVERTLGAGAGGGEETMIVLRDDLPLREARADFERQYLLRCLAATGGNIVELARHVGMERTHLYRKLRSLDIDLDKVRD